MEEPRIKTGGYKYRSYIRTARKNSAYFGIADITTAGTSVPDNIIGSFLGAVNLNTTTDTGTEVIDSAVLPAALAAERRMANHLIEKAAYLYTSSMRYRIKNKETFDRIRNKGNISQTQGNNSKSKRNLSDSDTLYNKYNYTACGVETPYRRNQTGKVRLRNAVRNGKKITYRKPKRIKTGEVKPIAAKISNAHIDKTKVTDSSIEGIQGIRQTKSNINRARQAASTTVNTVKALKTIATGRYINENAKKTFADRTFQDNTYYSRFYSTGVRVDMDSTANTGTEAVKALRIASVKVRNTAVAVKRTYRVGKKVYTQVKTVVRGTSRTVKSIKNAKKKAEKLKIAAKAVAGDVKTVVNSVRVMFNPVILKAAALLIGIIIIFNIVSSIMIFISTAFNSCFGWLYNPSEPDQSKQTVFENQKDRVFGFIEQVNENYNEILNKHDGYEYGFEDPGSDGYLISDIYRDVLSILIVQKQKLYGEYGMDPRGVYDLIDSLNLKDNEMQDVLDKFYDMSTYSGTYYCSGCYCPGHPGSHTPSCPRGCTSSHISYCAGNGCKCDGHSALYVKIVNKSRDSVMSDFGFTAEEKERAEKISGILEKIEEGHY
ncbi:MAG: hypothetical protein GX022_08860 [Clostridiaceae bacterium]|nr:hypothetical protein [Clostridiaceae bacterium]